MIKHLCFLTSFLLLQFSGTVRAQDGSVVTEDNQVGDWLVRCITEGDFPRECFMVTRAANALEQRDLAIIQVLRVLPENSLNGERFAAQLTTPTNVNVRAGILIQVDQNLIASVDYEVCTQRNCVTTFAVTDDMISALSLGFAGTLLLTDATGTQVSASFSLDGFSRASELL